MADNLNTISSSKYDIYTKLLDLCAANEYITSQEDFENTSFLKSGLFGYMTEAMAMAIRDSSFHKTMIYRENYLNTAIMPKTIYNNAKLFNVNIIDATPSLRYATITISYHIIDSIISNTSQSTSSYRTKYGITEQSNFMVLDKINPICAGEYYFSLEHSIEIYRNSDNKYIVKYCLSEKDKSTNFGTYSNGGIINTENVKIDNEDYLVFKVIVAQYKTVEKTKVIPTASFIDTKIHKFDYDGQICGLSATYIKGSNEENIELKYSNIELEKDMASSNKIAYYSLEDDNTIELSFAANSNAGVPSTGGIIKLKLYETEGLSGNISYYGEAVFSVKQEDIKSLPISVVLSTDIIQSGTDQSTLSELKSSIINKLSTRETIITENDLNLWFATQSKFLEDISNSKITFRKEKDNILKRTFAAYLLLRDGSSIDSYMTAAAADSDNTTTNTIQLSSYKSSVVPTNTIDVVITNNQVNAGKYSLSPLTNIKYNASTEQYSINDSSLDTDYNYKTPFILNLNTEYNTVSYTYLDVEDTSELEFTNIDSITDMTLIPTHVFVEHITPTVSGNDYYTFSFYFSSSAELSGNTYSGSINIGSQTISLSTLKFEKIDNEDDKNTSYLNNYKVVIKAKYDRISYESSDSSFIVLKDFTSCNVEKNGEYLFAENNKIGISIIGTDMDITATSVNELQLFSALDDVITSNIVVNRNESGITSYIIKDVPVVASYWYDSSINRSWFIRQLFVYINMLKANIDKLETTTFFNIKFRNSYGPSHYLNTTSTQLRLGLIIHIDKDKADAVAAATTNTTDNNYASLKNEIRDYVRICVDDANEDGELAISKIIMQVQARYYNFVKYIDFTGLNGTYKQVVKAIETNDISYPLEYFNLDQTLNSNYINNGSRLEDDIIFSIE